VPQTHPAAPQTHPAAPQTPSTGATGTTTIPPAAQAVMQHLKSSQGKKIPTQSPKGGVLTKYESGRFRNLEGKLPTHVNQIAGIPYNYIEHDVHPLVAVPPPGKGYQDRGKERVVYRVEDGKTFYTNDHYKTFVDEQGKQYK
jgi:hypothetical protein